MSKFPCIMRVYLLFALVTCAFGMAQRTSEARVGEVKGCASHSECSSSTPFCHAGTCTKCCNAIELTGFPKKKGFYRDSIFLKMEGISQENFPVYQNEDGKYLYYYSPLKEWLIGSDYTNLLTPSVGAKSSNSLNACPDAFLSWEHSFKGSLKLFKDISATCVNLASDLTRTTVDGECSGFVEYDSGRVLENSGDYEECKRYCKEEPLCRAVTLGDANINRRRTLPHCWFHYSSYSDCISVARAHGKSRACYNWSGSGQPNRNTFQTYVFSQDQLQTVGHPAWEDQCWYKRGNSDGCPYGFELTFTGKPDGECQQSTKNGGEYGTKTGQTMEQCGVRCLQDAGCFAFDFKNGYCYLNSRCDFQDEGDGYTSCKKQRTVSSSESKVASISSENDRLKHVNEALKKALEAMAK